MVVTRVSFALLLQDDFTGEDIVNGGHSFLVNGRRFSPLRKPEGYYVFTNVEHPCTVTVQSSHYMELTFPVDPKSVDPKHPVLTKRLTRRNDIRFSDCDRIEGIHKPGEAVYAFVPETPPLQLAAASGATITLQGYTAKQLCRKRYAVGTGKNRELFIITGGNTDGGYLIEPSLARRHTADEVLVRVYAGRCDAHGRFALAVEKGLGEKIKKLEFYDEEKKQWGSLSVTAPS